MKKLLLKRQEQYYKNPVENNSKKELPEEIEEIEEKHLRKVLEECRKPGKGILKKLDYYFIPGSLVKRETAYQFFRKGLENQFPEKFEISKLEKK